jgi:hypothetical protein
MYKEIWSDESCVHIYTDASNSGFGAVYGTEWFALIYAGHLHFLQDYSINFRELHAAVKAMATWGPILTGKAVIFHIDNQAVCGILNKLYSPVAELMDLVRTWCLLVEKYSIQCAVVYIATQDNVLADALSWGNIAEFRSRCIDASGGTWPTPIKYMDVVC